jgi:DNA polymerase elongation subunit (family B)
MKGNQFLEHVKIIFLFFLDIEDIYQMRLEAKKTNNSCLVDFFKLLMNSLYGKLGQKLNLQKNIVSLAELNELVMYYNENRIKNIKLLDGNCVEYEYEDVDEFFNQIGSLVRFAAFVTAQGRCLLLKPFADKVLNQQDLFYTDTDSIFVNKQLPNEYVSSSTLGKFKLEYEIKKGFFLAPKMYIVESSEGLKMKMKGIPKKQLKEEYFYRVKLYFIFFLDHGTRKSKN